VLEHLARGRSDDEIAHELYLSRATVMTHVGNVFMKLGLRVRAQAVVFAYESRLVRPSLPPADVTPSLPDAG
jgi:DNA-binding NarL/FixJ family response regulator